MVWIQSVDIYIGAAVMGIFTGFGNAIGSYLANKHANERLAKILQRKKGEQNEH